MGADGHIAIYDWSKTTEQFPELEQNETLKKLVIGGSYIYDNPFGEGNLLMVYWEGKQSAHKKSGFKI